MPTDMGGLDRFLHAFTGAIGAAYGIGKLASSFPSV